MFHLQSTEIALRTSCVIKMEHRAPRLSDALPRWNSTSIFIFGGLALLLWIVTVALLKLSSNRNNRDIGAASDAQMAKPGGGGSGGSGSGGPVVEIVVIMAGDQNPTHMARPAPVPSCQSVSEQL
ncbi:hypothetical protein ACJRO7_008251 [Eucalyptus globulus]|uniref:Uncharacterized protein n=1 Tax=Eucalyptus globulus TaxID=34317 RepID=A0ABD3IQL8_EUCGL